MINKPGTYVPPGTLLKIKANCDLCKELSVIGGKTKVGIYRGRGKDKLCQKCAKAENII